MNTYIIACSGPKATGQAPAADLYTGSTFTNTYATARELAAADLADGEAASVLILSARYGLIDPADVVAPYDTRIDDADAISDADLAVQLASRALGTITCLLPGAYFRALARAAELVNADRDVEDAGEWLAPMDAFEAAPGVGFQRGVCRSARALG